jgi:hypothetical protein
LGNVVGKKFQGNLAAKPHVLGFVDDAHASAAEFFKDGVMGDGAADNGRRVWHWPGVYSSPSTPAIAQDP